MDKKLEKRVAQLEKLLSKDQMKNEGVYNALLDDPRALSKFRTMNTIVRKAHYSLNKIYSLSRECDQAAMEMGGDQDTIPPGELSRILRGVLADLWKLNTMTNLEMNAEDE